MKSRHLSTVLVAMILATGIFLYNFWSYSCGRCTKASLFVLSPPAIILILCNVAAFLLLCGVKSRSRRRINRQFCGCGSLLDQSWLFCPSCGSACKETSSV